MAADVNKTIAVDLVEGFGWKIDDDSVVTSISAHMVNGEQIGVFRIEIKNGISTIKKCTLPGIQELEKAKAKANLIISDKIIEHEITTESVIYRPPSLVI